MVAGRDGTTKAGRARGSESEASMNGRGVTIGVTEGSKGGSDKAWNESENSGGND